MPLSPRGERGKRGAKGEPPWEPRVIWWVSFEENRPGRIVYTDDLIRASARGRMLTNLCFFSYSYRLPVTGLSVSTHAAYGRNGNSKTGRDFTLAGPFVFWLFYHTNRGCSCMPLMAAAMVSGSRSKSVVTVPVAFAWVLRLPFWFRLASPR